MKKTYPTSTKARQWAKHLKKGGKRVANKGTRKVLKLRPVYVTDADQLIDGGMAG
jgi:hypothetical protein